MGAFDSLVGAFLIGTLLNYILLGVCWMQTMTYYQNCRESERWIYKVAVGFLFVVGAVHSAVSGYTMYESTVTNFGNIKNLYFIPFSFCLDPILTAVIALVVEIFYAHRVYIISGRSKIVPAIIIFLGLVQLGIGFFCTVYAFHHPSYITIGAITWAVASWLCLMAGADCLITGVIYYHLSKSKSTDGYAQTNSVIEKVIRLVVASNLLTSVTSIISAAFFAFGAGAWHVIAGLIISKFYQISLLASLNSRTQLERDIQGARTYVHPKPSVTEALSHLGGNSLQEPPMTSVHLRRGSYTGSVRSTKEHGASSLDPIQVTVDTETTEFRVEDWNDRQRPMDRPVGDSNGLLPVPTDSPFAE